MVRLVRRAQHRRGRAEPLVVLVRIAAVDTPDQRDAVIGRTAPLVHGAVVALRVDAVEVDLDSIEHAAESSVEDGQMASEPPEA